MKQVIRACCRKGKGSKDKDDIKISHSNEVSVEWTLPEDTRAC